MAFSFINPYNFIPLGKPANEEHLPWERKGKEKNTGESDKLTGKIEYTLTTLSPLFVPNTSNDRVFSKSNVLLKDSTEENPIYHKSFEFFSYKDFKDEKNLDKKEADYAPVIPGSEIRGAIRSIYEALTDSCLSAIDLDAVLSKRTPEYFTPGILEWDDDRDSTSNQRGWKLYTIDNRHDYLYRENHRDDFSVKTFANMDIMDGTQVTFRKDTVNAPGRSRYAKPLADDVRPMPTSGKVLRGRLTGYLVKGEPGPDLAKPSSPKCGDCPSKTKSRCMNEGGKHCYLAEKHCAHIFVKPEKESSKLDYMLVKVYEKQISQILKVYRDNEKNKYIEYARAWEEFLNPAMARREIPIYFSQISDSSGEQFFFSPACITREVYLKTLKDIVGNYAPCSAKTRCLCPACRLFGTIHGGLHVYSRLRFSDLHLNGVDLGNNLDEARLTDNQKVEGAVNVSEGKEKGYNPDVFMPVVTLPELSTPKISSTEFYLRKPTADNILNWTYDYYISLNGLKPELHLKDYVPVISGRKFYWHSKAADQLVFNQQNLIETTGRNRTIRPVKDHVCFKGTVFFDGISGKELQEIISILNMSVFGEEDRYAIKLV